MDSAPPPPFDPDSGSFADYTERLEFYFESVDLDLTSVFPSDPDYQPKLDRLKSKRRAVLLSNCGAKCFEVLKSAAAPLSVKELSYEELCDVATNHFDTATNPTRGRYVFCSRHRGPHESFTRYHQVLLGLAGECNFGRGLEERLRDQIVCGIGDSELVEAMIQDKNLQYGDVISICKGLDEQMRGNVLTVDIILSDHDLIIIYHLVNFNNFTIKFTY